MFEFPEAASIRLTGTAWKPYTSRLLHGVSERSIEVEEAPARIGCYTGLQGHVFSTFRSIPVWAHPSLGPN